MNVAVVQTHRRSLHPLHAALLAGTVPLFLGALPSDIAYAAALGLAFAAPAMGVRFAEGVFIGEHGSWNRGVPIGYRVSFVPFRDGRPSRSPVDFVAGFRDADGNHTRGRPVGVTVDPRGALIVADDLSNTVCRVTPTRQQAASQGAEDVARQQ